MPYVQNDAGRSEAGFKGKFADCSVRSICIAVGLPYREVYNRFVDMGSRERDITWLGRPSHPLRGIRQQSMHKFLNPLGWHWRSMFDSRFNRRRYLCAADLPKGRLIVIIHDHSTAVIDHVIHDNFPQVAKKRWLVKGFFYEARAARSTFSQSQRVPHECDSR